MIDMIVTIIGTGFFILGFLLVITTCLYIMGKKDDETVRQDQYYH